LYKLYDEEKENEKLIDKNAQKNICNNSETVLKMK